jgi:hypothetical protein
LRMDEAREGLFLMRLYQNISTKGLQICDAKTYCLCSEEEEHFAGGRMDISTTVLSCRFVRTGSAANKVNSWRPHPHLR